MAKTRNKKHENRVKKLVAMVILCAVVLSVSTYAWFIGMKTVNINAFDISIKSTEGLFLSMDGKNWSYNLTVDKEGNPYAKHTNTFAENGLIPMSSVGDMDAASSTMKLFEKGSLTSVPGGMRLLASKVSNTTIATDKVTGTEGAGYVAFDLFVKNISGQAYYAENDPLNEEAIYLTNKSEVKVGTAGTEATDAQKNTGIQNSVRVGFAQIGRMSAEGNEASNDEATATKITEMTCAGDEEAGITGICRKAQIWEPNDNKHVDNALNWYKTSCLQRKAEGTTVTAKDSYGEKCADLPADGTHHPTYAISDVIALDDEVNIYDGAAYNTYEKSTKLVDFPYFTDTMKIKKGTERPEFMTLAPNSITKIRVYIWLEGQDIDNYDFASLGTHIAVNFGFTKERYKEEDFADYDGPSTGTNEEQTADKTTEPIA